MNKKKLVVVYSYLFLFVFAFAFGFTMASKAHADGGNCCVYSYCPPPYDYEVSQMGHRITLPKGGYACEYTGGNACDVTYLCP